jgi:hypothetical protein
MAKKVRRAKKKKRKATPVVTAVDAAEKPAEKVAKVKETSAESFRQEYAYVIKDLRRVLLVSGAMFMLLIVINLLLQ